LLKNIKGTLKIKDNFLQFLKAHRLCSSPRTIIFIFQNRRIVSALQGLWYTTELETIYTVSGRRRFGHVNVVCVHSNPILVGRRGLEEGAVQGVLE
jgi:hypothetical protein